MSPNGHKATITELYDLHVAGKLASDDPRWTLVQTALRRLAGREVTKANARLYGEPKKTRVEDVYTRLLCKFIAKRFTYKGSHLDPLLARAASNDVRDSFRRSRSPSTVCFDGAEATWEDKAPEVTHEDVDVFGDIRRSFQPFRFPEHPHVREAVLVFFLTNRRYPGAAFLNSLTVPHAVRCAVYNAALVDINAAMMAYTRSA